MALAAYQGTATDPAGNVLTWPFSVRVMSDDAGSPRMARLYEDTEGLEGENNAMVVTADKGWEPGFFRFYTRGGRYRILVFKGAWEAEELRHVGIGTYSEADQGSLNDAGYLLEYEVGTGEPASGFFRFDAEDLSAAAECYVSKTTRGGFDFAVRLLELDPGISTKRNTAIFAGVNGGGASWLVDSATDSGDFVTLAIDGHSGDTTFELDLYSLQRELAGPLGPAVDPGDVVTITGAFTYDSDLHAYTMIDHNVASEAQVTLPANAPKGAGFQLTQAGLGKALFVAAGGGALRHALGHARTLKQFAVVGVYVRSNVGGNAAEWVLFGASGQ